MHPAAALLVASGAPSLAAIIWTVGDPPDPVWLGVGIVVVAVLALGVSLVYSPLAAWTALRKSHTPVYETLPRETTGPVLVIPIATTVSTSLLTVGVSVGTLTLGEDPPVPAQLRAYMGLCCVVGLLVGLLVPWVVVQFIRREREGTDVALFDSHAAADRVLASLDSRWEGLYDEPRIWYPVRRTRALGTRESPSISAWPLSDDLRLTGPRKLIYALVAGNLFAIMLLGFDVFVNTNWTNWFGTISFVLLPGTSTALAIVLVSYTLTAQEQRNADLLRRAEATAKDRLSTEARTDGPATSREGPSRGGVRGPDSVSSQRVMDELARDHFRAQLAQMTRVELLAHAISKRRSWR